jgi:antitoxin MazE
MQVSKWGNSLAVRLPAEVVEALELKHGDQIEIRVAGAREFEVCRDRSRERALERLRRLRRPLPAGFTFDRAAMNGLTVRNPFRVRRRESLQAAAENKS